MTDKIALLVVGMLAMVMFFAYAVIITIFQTKLDPEIQGAVLGILGSGGFTVVIAYFFGSSAGSAAKTESMIRNANGKGPALRVDS